MLLISEIYQKQNRCRAWFIPLYKKNFKHDSSIIGFIFNALCAIPEIEPYINRIKDIFSHTNAYRSVKELDDFLGVLRAHIIRDVQTSESAVLLSKEFFAGPTVPLDKSNTELKDRRNYTVSSNPSIRSDYSQGRLAIGDSDSDYRGDTLALLDDEYCHEFNDIAALSPSGQPSRSHIGDAIANFPCLTMLTMIDDGKPRHCHNRDCSRRSHDIHPVVAYANNLLANGLWFNPPKFKAYLASHDFDADRQSAIQLWESSPSFKKSPYPVSRPTAPTSILKRDSPSMSLLDARIPANTLSSLQLEAFKSFSTDLADTEHAWLAQIHAFSRTVLSAIPTSKPFHVLGDLVVGTLSIKSIPTLLDTGTTQQNYISRTVYEANRDMFASFYQNV